MKEVLNGFINNTIKLKRWQMVGIIFLIVVISGVFGWIYEFIFYYFNGGMKKFYWQGGNFLPWINIYATGSLMILFLTRKVRRNPAAVFIIAFISTGILEYVSGYGIYKLCGGLRLWDYNREILNFGNIDGFVCLRSVLFFGVAALLLVYFIVPVCILISKKMSKKSFMILSISLFSLFMFDEFYNLVFARILSLPRATDIYKELGVNYMTYYRYK